MKSPNPFRTLGLWLTFRSRPFIWPIATVLLTVNLLYTFMFEDKKVDPNIHHITQTLNQIDSEMRGTAEGWIETDNDSLYLDRLWRQGTPASWNKNGVSLVLYQDTSLVYWTVYPGTIYNNKPNQLHSTGTLDQVGTAQILTKQYHDDNKTAVVIIKLRDNTKHEYNPHIFREQRINLLPAQDSIRAALLRAEPVTAADNSFFVEAKQRNAIPWWVEICGWMAILLITLQIKNIFRRKASRKNAFPYSIWLLLTLVFWRMVIYYTGIPNETGELFNRVYGQHNLLLESLGDLLLSFSILFIYASYLYQIRYKLNWQYQHSSKTRQIIMAGLISFLTALIVAVFHYALILSIYTPKINIQIYDIFDLSYASAMFYLLTVLFFAVRILVTQMNLTIFSPKSFIPRTAATIIFILLILLPFEPEIQYSGYALSVFFLIYTLLDYARVRYSNYGAFLLSLLVFTAYITYFATQENSRAQNNAQKTYAKILATSAQDRAIWQNEETNSGPGSLDIRFRNFTYARLTADQVTFKYNNSNDYQSLLAETQQGRDTTISMDGQSHFVYFYYGPYEEQEGILVISRRETTFLDAASLYVYIFLILFIVGAILLEFSGYTFNILQMGSRMTMRIRAVVIGVVIFAMGAVTWVIIDHTMGNFHDAKRQFINNNIQRLSVSLNQYMTHSPANVQHFREWLAGEKNEWAFNINLYSLDGNLIVTSMEEMQSIPRMESEAFRYLNYMESPYFVTGIDAQMYISAYVPILKNNERVGYLNMRYHSPQNDSGLLQQELLTDILNLFLIILFIAVIMSEILYRFLTKPFTQLHEAMSNISQMQKIDAVRSSRKISDEIGQLVQQYNLMIDYLEDSYRQLARSEREGAWREMARQVAHEIKNPLTPMRLRIQMLQRAMKEENCENMKPKVESTLDLLLEQIGLLNNIASEFSDFAKLGEGNPKRTDLVPLVCNVAKLYSGYENVGIRLHYDCGCRPNDLNRETEGSFDQEASSVPILVTISDKPIWVMADPDHLTRVFVNICLNAVQAIGQQKDGWIDIDIRVVGVRVLVMFRDNGPGMTEEVKRKIFQPNFTTKSSGSGLGLALSKKIIELLGGTIDFDSTTEGQERGTVFIVNLPLATPALD